MNEVTCVLIVYVLVVLIIIFKDRIDKLPPVTHLELYM